MSKAGASSAVKTIGNKAVYQKEEILQKEADRKAAIANGEIDGNVFDLVDRASFVKLLLHIYLTSAFGCHC